MKLLLISKTNNMRISVGLVIFFLISVTSAYAQGGHSGKEGRKASSEERAKSQTEKMKEHLSLTVTQESKVLSINQKYNKKMEDVRNIADKTTQKKSVEDLNKQREGEFKDVLTADQFKTYLKLVEQLKARQRGMRK